MIQTEPTLRSAIADKIHSQSQDTQDLFLVDAINLTGYCRVIRPEIEAKIGRKVKITAMIMCIKRLLKISKPVR